MKNRSVHYLNGHAFLVFSFVLAVSCKQSPLPLSPAQMEENKEQATAMALNISKDISKNGPAAWLNYFENTPDFFMASDGNLVFKDYESARKFILNTLVKTVPQIKLRWENIKTSVISDDFATLGAAFKEELTDTTGKVLFVTGYFTGTAHKTDDGWKLRNAHWSIKPTAK